MIILNWKCNPDSEAEAISLARDSDYDNFTICPPYLFISVISRILKKAGLGSQDAFWSSGAYTGAISTKQLAESGVKYAIIGHSERRINFNEKAGSISQKISACLTEDIVPVLCLGEIGLTGPEKAKSIVLTQLKTYLRLISAEQAARIVYVYEPSGAIGSGKPDSPTKIKAVAREIINWSEKRSEARPKIFYGGSINSRNAGTFLAIPGISGLLVGGASLNRSEIRKLSLIHE